MTMLTRDDLRRMMDDVLRAQGKQLPPGDATSLRDIGFRSLDFSEVALRLEDEVGRELNFDAPELREISTVGDVLDFLELLQKA